MVLQSAQVMFGNYHVLNYFDELRKADGISFREDGSRQRQDEGSSRHPERISSILAVTDPATGEEIRLGNVPVILPFSWFGESPTEDAVDLAMAVTMAIYHFNLRNAAIVPELKSSVLEGCNVKLTFDLWDGEYSAAATSAAFVYDVMSNVNASAPLKQPYPTAIVGARWSGVTSILSKLSSAYGIPLISPSASSTEFSSKVDHPLFLRTVPSVSAHAVALVDYFEMIGVRHFGVLFDSASFALTFANAVVDTATSRGMKVLHIPVSYYKENATTREIQQAMKEFKRIQYKYFFTINFDMAYFNEVLTEAFYAGLTGPEYSWWMSDGISFKSFSEGLVYPQDDPLVQAMNSIGFLHLSEPHRFQRYPTFKKEWNILGQDPVAAAYIKEKLPKDIKAKLGDSFSFRKDPDIMSLFVYDSLITIGMGACAPKALDHHRVEAAENDSLTYFFTGPELYQSMVRTHFQGASNDISFQHTTGNRNYGDDLLFIANARLNEKSDNAGKSVLRLYPSAAYVPERSKNVMPSPSPPFTWKSSNPFIFPNNSTKPPLDLPPLVSHTHMITPGALAGGLAMTSVALLLGFACLGWTWLNSGKPYVRASQPELLAMICFGCIIMAFSVIPAAVQCSSMRTKHLCMATPWMVCIGFVISFSVLYSKTLQINKLMLAKTLRKTLAVRKRDVVLPFVLLLVLNIIMLSVWSVIAPMEWIQKDFISIDQFGRSVESIAMCGIREGNELAAILCVVILAAINFTNVALAAYQGYLCRNVKIKFNESNSIFICLMSILQISVISVPVFVTVLHLPSARFVVYSLLVSLLCSSILVPLFTPKWVAVQKGKKGAKNSKQNSYEDSSSVNMDQLRTKRRQQRQQYNKNACGGNGSNDAPPSSKESVVLSLATFQAPQKRRGNFALSSFEESRNDDPVLDDLSRALQDESQRHRLLLEEKYRLESGLEAIMCDSPEAFWKEEEIDDGFSTIVRDYEGIDDDSPDFTTEKQATDDDFEPDPEPDEDLSWRHNIKNPFAVQDEADIEKCSSLNFFLRRINFDELYTDTFSSRASSFSQKWASSKRLDQVSVNDSELDAS